MLFGFCSPFRPRISLTPPPRSFSLNVTNGGVSCSPPPPGVRHNLFRPPILTPWIPPFSPPTPRFFWKSSRLRPPVPMAPTKSLLPFFCQPCVLADRVILAEATPSGSFLNLRSRPLLRQKGVALLSAQYVCTVSLPYNLRTRETPPFLVSSSVRPVFCPHPISFCLAKKTPSIK